jgi:hypothetical protein
MRTISADGTTDGNGASPAPSRADPSPVSRSRRSTR